MTTLPETNRLPALDPQPDNDPHRRINIPINLDNWKHLDDLLQADLLWWHQHLLDEKVSYITAGETINYDQSTVFRVLKGNYEGSWPNVHKAIRSYRKLADARGTIQQAEFARNWIALKI